MITSVETKVKKVEKIVVEETTEIVITFPAEGVSLEGRIEITELLGYIFFSKLPADVGIRLCEEIGVNYSKFLVGIGNLRDKYIKRMGK